MVVLVAACVKPDLSRQDQEHSDVSSVHTTLQISLRLRDCYHDTRGAFTV